MSFAKWIGASVGWSFGGPIGAIIGLALGSLVDNSSGKSQTQKRMRAQTQPGDFEVSLLILASLSSKLTANKTGGNWILCVANLYRCTEKNALTRLLDYLKQLIGNQIFRCVKSVCKFNK